MYPVSFVHWYTAFSETYNMQQLLLLFQVQRNDYMKPPLEKDGEDVYRHYQDRNAWSNGTLNHETVYDKHDFCLWEGWFSVIGTFPSVP